MLAAAGVTGRIAAVSRCERRAHGSKANPWIADATVLKLYPDRLQIAVKEREAFALWQKDGRVARDRAPTARCSSRSSIAAFAALPLVVGAGAEKQAQRFSRHARSLSGRSAIRCAPTCWSRTGAGTCGSRTASTSGCRKPSRSGARRRSPRSIATRRLLSRDIAAIDLRLPDRVTVRLSDAAAQARDGADQGARKAKRKGGDA